MSQQEMPAVVSKDRDDYTKNEAALAEKKGKNVDDMNDDELEKLLAERKSLKSANEDLMNKAREEATVENTEYDAEKAQQIAEEKIKEEKARAEQAVEHEAKVAEDRSKAAVLAEQIKSGKIGDSAEDGEKHKSAYETQISKSENRGNIYAEFDKNKAFSRGEAEVALSQGDVQGFQEAYIKMTENTIARLEAYIKNVNEDFSDGSFQKNFRENMMQSATDEYVQGNYEYQKKSIQDQIQQMRVDSIELVKSNPAIIIQREKFDEKADKTGMLGRMLKEAGNLLQLEKKAGVKKGAMYPTATAIAEGAISAALRYKDPKVIAYLKDRFDGDLPTTSGVLSPELQKQIHDVKV